METIFSKLLVIPGIIAYYLVAIHGWGGFSYYAPFSMVDSTPQWVRVGLLAAVLGTFALVGLSILRKEPNNLYRTLAVATVLVAVASVAVEYLFAWTLFRSLP